MGTGDGTSVGTCDGNESDGKLVGAGIVLLKTVGIAGEDIGSIEGTCGKVGAVEGKEESGTPVVGNAVVERNGEMLRTVDGTAVGSSMDGEVVTDY